MINIPIFTGLYTSQVVSRISSINSTKGQCLVGLDFLSRLVDDGCSPLPKFGTLYCVCVCFLAASSLPRSKARHSSTGWPTKCLDLFVFNMNILLAINQRKHTCTRGYINSKNNKQNITKQIAYKHNYKITIKKYLGYVPCQLCSFRVSSFPRGRSQRWSDVTIVNGIQVAWNHTLPHTAGHMTPRFERERTNFPTQNPQCFFVAF